METSTDADSGVEPGHLWHVLVVGTPGAARGELISALCQRGASVRMTPDLVSARSALRQARFDAVITLPELPDGTGFALLASVRERHADAPLVIMVESDPGWTESEPRAVWFSRTGTRPDLFDVIRDACNRSRRGRQRRVTLVGTPRGRLDQAVTLPQRRRQ